MSLRVSSLHQFDIGRVNKEIFDRRMGKCFFGIEIFLFSSSEIKKGKVSLFQIRIAIK